MNIKDINAAWIEAGQKVDDLNAKITAALVDEEVSAEEIADMKAKRDDAVMRRDSLKDQLAHRPGKTKRLLRLRMKVQR